MAKKGYKMSKRGVSMDEPGFDGPKKPVSYPPQSSISKAGKEMKANPPAILAKTKKKKGSKAAQKQKVAIMLSKARRGY